MLCNTIALRRRAGGEALTPLSAALAERRRYIALFSDLRFILAIPDVPAYFLSRPHLIKQWVLILDSLQAADTQAAQPPCYTNVLTTIPPLHY